MRKLPSLPYVKYVRSKGKIYAYFNTGKLKAGKPIYARLPDPAGAGFHDSYAAMKGARTKRENKPYTVADMWVEFEASKTFEDHAKATRNLYRSFGRKIVAEFGEYPAFDLERSDVQLVVDQLPSPAQHNMFVAVLGALYKWGRERDKTEAKPTEGIAPRKTGEHEPWPEELVEAGLASKHDRTRLAIHLLYFTGQRIGDVLKMRWSDIDRHGVIHVVQQKRGKEVWVPLLSELKAELDRTPRRGMTIITSEAGRQMGDDVIRRELKAFTQSHGIATVPHGLRKNAVIAFLEAGCTPDEVAAITGQSMQMVMHYSKQINRKRLSHEAVIKLENKRGKRKPTGKLSPESA